VADVVELGVEGGQQSVADRVVEDDRGVLVGFEAADVDDGVPAVTERQGGDAAGGLGAAGAQNKLGTVVRSSARRP
jgi:hypothetical protein